MDPVSAITLITSLLSAVPEIVGDVEKVIADLKNGNAPAVPLSPEVHAAMDDLHSRIMLAALAARAKG
jgi:hypothetical protein